MAAYAIFKTGGKQYRVQEGDKVDVEKLDANVGDTITFDTVLLVSRGDKEGDTTIGAPLVSGVKITAEVVDQFKDKKVTAFKFRKRKGYKKTKGHRRQLTRLAIKGF